MYIGVNDKSKTINQIFIGVNDKAKLIDNAFIGVNNIAEQLIKKIDFPTYTGSHAVFGDLNRGRMELYESGTLVMPAGWKIDIFAVGGGARGGEGSVSPGGGGGYTKTAKGFWGRNQEKYDVYIGGSDGTTSIKHKNLGSVIVALHGNYQETNPRYKGGDGGSGGGDAGLYKGSANYSGGAGGSDGGNGQATNGWGGKGQGSTTRAFGEVNNTLYAGGGGGAPGNGGTPGAGGKGGGGYGGYGTNGISGTPNTGGGGGGHPESSDGETFRSGYGGSGIVIIRWGY